MKESQTMLETELEENINGSKVSSCCLDTIKELAQNNPMMACQHCGKIIKCFREESSFNKYALFCESRKRNIQKANYETYKIILFKKQ